MIKSLLIVILLALLAGGAWLSRPSQEQFNVWYTQAHRPATGGLLDKALAEVQISNYLKNAQFKDRYLWTHVNHEGKTAYVGAFSRWFEWNAK